MDLTSPIHRREAMLAAAGAGAMIVARTKAARAGTFTRTLLAGTRWQTVCHVRSTGRPGPVLLVMGGVHGDEPAGALAADSIRKWPLSRGSLLVIPRTNQPALKAGSRYSPGSPHPDLARCFPRRRGEPAQGVLADTLWRLIVRLQPDWLLDLHEGWGVHRRNPRTLGSTVMHGPSSRTQAESMARAVNATIDDPRDHFVSVDRFIPGSSVDAASRFLFVRCLVQETTRVGRTLALRVAHHETMASQLLTDFGMT